MSAIIYQPRGAMGSIIGKDPEYRLPIHVLGDNILMLAHIVLLAHSLERRSALM